MSKKRDRYLRRTYGISLLDYQDMWFEQNGCCLICDDYFPGNQMVVDHDHDTGEIRGLLCSKCNSGLGFFGDNEEGLEAAYNYFLR